VSFKQRDRGIEEPGDVSVHETDEHRPPRSHRGNALAADDAVFVLADLDELARAIRLS
jgi:hypothetical protein